MMNFLVLALLQTTVLLIGLLAMLSGFATCVVALSSLVSDPGREWAHENSWIVLPWLISLIITLVLGLVIPLPF